MTTDSIIFSVNEVYKSLDKHLEIVAANTGLQCSENCGACCDKKDIDASPIEYYPLAAWLYRSGQIDEYLKLLDEYEENGYCPLYDSRGGIQGKGNCRQYKYRGLTCRLFGFGYRFNKENIPDLVTCRIMKKNIPSAVLRAKQLGMEQPGKMPVFSDYFMQLFSIEPEISIKRFPVKEAIRIAIENLYFHFLDNKE
jgi:uncharacterized protein